MQKVFYACNSIQNGSRFNVCCILCLKLYYNCNERRDFNKKYYYYYYLILYGNFIIFFMKNVLKIKYV